MNKKYMLDIPIELHREIKLEAFSNDTTMSAIMLNRLSSKPKAQPKNQPQQKTPIVKHKVKPKVPDIEGVVTGKEFVKLSKEEWDVKSTIYQKGHPEENPYE